MKRKYSSGNVYSYILLLVFRTITFRSMYGTTILYIQLLLDKCFHLEYIARQCEPMLVGAYLELQFMPYYFLKKVLLVYLIQMEPAPKDLESQDKNSSDNELKKASTHLVLEPMIDFECENTSCPTETLVSMVRYLIESIVLVKNTERQFLLRVYFIVEGLIFKTEHVQLIEFTGNVKNIFLWEGEHYDCTNDLILQLEALLILSGRIRVV